MSKDTNQASEDELLDCLIDKTVEARYLWSKQSAEARQMGHGNTGFTKYQKELKEAHESAKASIQALIRTEKLKLLAEVREQVVGGRLDLKTFAPALEVKPDLETAVWVMGKDRHNELIDKQLAALTKLEAEL